MQRVVQFCLLCFVFLSLVACNKSEKEHIDLRIAHDAYVKRDWITAITHSKRFLGNGEDLREPELKKAWFILADATQAIGQMRESAQVLEAMLEGDFSQAVLREAYEKLLRKYNYGNLGDTANICLEMVNRIDMPADEKSEILLNAARSLQNNRDYERAEAVLNKISDFSPNNNITGVALMYRGHGQKFMGNMTVARGYLTKAIELYEIEDAEKGQMYFYLGEILESMEKYKEAYINFEKAMPLYPNRLKVENRLKYLDHKFSTLVVLD